MTFRALPRPVAVTDPALKLLYDWGRDRQTGVVGTALTLANPPVPGTLLLWKNGALLDPEDAAVLTLAHRTVTLGVASIAGDIWVATYYYRSQATG